MYPPRLIEHFQNPRNVGELGPPAITVEVENPACGDILRLSVRFEDGRAAEVRDEIIRLGWGEGRASKYLILLDAAVVVRHPDGSFTLDRQSFPAVTNIQLNPVMG